MENNPLGGGVTLGQTPPKPERPSHGTHHRHHHPGGGGGGDGDRSSAGIEGTAEMEGLTDKW